jgi:hypothetical protein
LNDHRYASWRYLTVESVNWPTVVARSRSGRKSTWKTGRFGRGSRWAYCGHDGPGVLPPYSDRPIVLGCGSCPPVADALPLTYPLDPGFGFVEVTRDGVAVFTDYETDKTLAMCEQLARETPGDWRLTIATPMRERVYQRHGPDRWVLVAIGMGFA